MNTNYETVKSLVELLVKKSGFDLSKNLGEEELEKTRSYIFEFEKKLSEVQEDEKKDVEETIDSLKKREETWSNNAEVLGRNILDAYNKKKPFKSIEETLNKLVLLARKEEDSAKNTSLMSYVHDAIHELEQKQENIEKTLSKTDYNDINSKEIDEQTVSYLNNKLIEYQNELKHINEEIVRINGIETRDISTISSIKVYLSNTAKNLEKLEYVKKETADKEIKTDVWAKLEKARLEIKRKYNNAKDTLEKFEVLLQDMTESKEEYSRRKIFLEEKIEKCNQLINRVSEHIENNQYADYTNRALDENKKEIITTELNELKNKKEVIYINVDEVKKEIIKEWSLIDDNANFSLNSNNNEQKEYKLGETIKNDFDW